MAMRMPRRCVSLSQSVPLRRGASTWRWRYTPKPQLQVGSERTVRRSRLVRGSCRCAVAVAAATPLFIAQQYYMLRSAYSPLERPPRTPVDGMEHTYFCEGECCDMPIDKRGQGGEAGVCRLIIIGDSLVCGIGSDKSGAAALCGQVASDIAKEKNQRVSWSSFGLDGGSAKSIGSMVPAISNYVRRQSDGCGELIILLIVGLNDYKNAVSGPGSDEFGRNLEELVTSINTATGQRAKIFMPVLPFDAVPLIQKYYPLTVVVKRWIHSYEDKKRALSEKVHNLTCIHNFTNAECAELGHTTLWSRDGVHPNFQGYQVMGNILTKRIVADREKMRKRIDEEWQRLQTRWQRRQRTASEANTR